MRMPAIIHRNFSLKCRQCAAVGVPVRVDSQTPETIVLALQCLTCGLEWLTQGDLPVFLAWVKPDRRRKNAHAKQVH